MDIFWPDSDLEFTTEIVNGMMEKDCQYFLTPFYTASAELTSERQSIILWMEQMYDEICQNNCNNNDTSMLNDNKRRCVHLSVLLLDQLLNACCCSLDNVYVFASICVFVAAKFELQHNCTDNMDKIRAKLRLSGHGTFDRAQMLNAEMQVLQKSNWNLHLPLTIEFANYFWTRCDELCQARENQLAQTPNTRLVGQDQMKTPVYNKKRKHPFTTPPSTIVKLPNRGGVDSFLAGFETLKFLLDLTLKDLKFRCFKSSILAASIVSASRLYHNLTPCLNFLAQISGYTGEMLNPCFNAILISVEYERQCRPYLLPKALLDSLSKSLQSPLATPPPVMVPIPKLIITTSSLQPNQQVVSSAGGTNVRVYKIVQSKNSQPSLVYCAIPFPTYAFVTTSEPTDQGTSSTVINQNSLQQQRPVTRSLKRALEEVVPNTFIGESDQVLKKR